MDPDGITVIDDAKEEFELIREIIKSKDQEDAFYLCDIGDLIHSHRNWLSKMPRVKPYYADSENEVLDDIDPSLKVISEPGRYYVSSAFTLASFIHGKRTVDDGKHGTRYMYHIDDDTFGSFSEVVLGRSTPIPRLFRINFYQSPNISLQQGFCFDDAHRVPREAFLSLL